MPESGLRNVRSRPRLLCIGDTHIGAWPRYADHRVDEQEAVIRRALEIAQERDCHGVLFAGDATHEPRPAPEHYLAWIRPFRDAGLPVLGIAGNAHDTRTAELPIPLDVLAGGNIRLSRIPEIIDFCGVQVATLPWTPVSRLVAANGGGDRDEINVRAAELLLDTARGLRARVDRDRPAVLLGHWSISGAVTPDGADVGLFREPVLDRHELDDMEWDAVVFGHIHRPQMVSPGSLAVDTIGSHRAAGRPIIYTGSPMPLNFGEAGSDHGVWILDASVGASSVEFVAIDSRRFLTLDFDHEDPAAQIALSESLGWDVMDAIVKLRYRCTVDQAREIDDKAIQASLIAAGAHRAYVEPDIVRVARARVDGLDEQVDDTRALNLWIDSQGYEGPEHDVETFVTQLRDRHSTYAEAVTA